MLEFVLIGPTILLLGMGMIDAATYYQDRILLQTALRGGVRYASVRPESWSSLATASANSIEGVIQKEASPLSITNDNSHIAIKYYKWDGSTETQCGSYDQSSNTFVPVSPYTESGCIVVGNFVKISLTYTWVPTTPAVNSVLNFTPAVTFTYTMVIG